MSRPTDGGFLSRWSRRKQQARSGEPALEDDPRAVPLPSAPGPAVEEQADAVDEDALSDEELLARYELPDPSTLTASDDVAAFMRNGVPKRLRNMALRRVWRLDPVLANLDGLNDYDEDYTDAAMLVGAAVKTAYQVGKGGAAHLQEAAEKLAADEPERDGAEELPEPVDEPQGPESGGRAAAQDAPPEAPETGADPEPGEPGAGDASREGSMAGESVPASQRRRRMVFATPDGGEIPAESRRLDN